VECCEQFEAADGVALISRLLALALSGAKLSAGPPTPAAAASSGSVARASHSEDVASDVLHLCFGILINCLEQSERCRATFLRVSVADPRDAAASLPALQLILQLFNWCIARELARHPPADKPAQQQQQQRQAQLGEAPEAWQRIAADELELSVTVSYCALVIGCVLAASRAHRESLRKDLPGGSFAALNKARLLPRAPPRAMPPRRVDSDPPRASRFWRTL
jgi:hypothetical protein